MTGVEFEVIFDDGGDFNVDFDQGEPQNIEFDEEIVINGGGGGASSLSDLDDVDLSSPSDGQVLGYDADSGKWTNQNAGGGAVDSVNGQTGTVVLDAGDLGYDENETYSSGTVGDAITDLKAEISEMSGLSTDAKEALLACFEKVAWIDGNGQDYYDALYHALYDNTWAITNTLSNCVTSNASTEVEKGGAYSATITAGAGYTLVGATVVITMGGVDITSSAYNNGVISIASVTGALVITISAVTKTVSSISAVYTQSGTVYNTDSLDSLKTDLVVTATYEDSSTATVTSYTLSGTLNVGSSTITASYGGKSATFTVTVTLNRAAIFGTFVNGHAISKAVSAATGMPKNGIFVSSASARAAFSTPIANSNYTITVTDASKYNVAVYDVTDNTPVSTSFAQAIENVYFTGGSKSISWKTTDSATTSYIFISLKKLDNTDFTAEELANGAEAVFTFTTS